MKRRLYIQLGRIGDILNILPLCLADYARTFQKPVLQVAAGFASILEGVTYVEPLIFEGDFEDVARAWKEAEIVAAREEIEIVCTQIYGRNICTRESCSSFLREAWAQVPGAPAWGSLPLVFDRRDKTRETGVTRHLLQRARVGRPHIVLALNGTSSPFPNYARLAAYLRNKIGPIADIVDISAFIAPRFYDLLGILENAAALVACDSAVLHLAAAVPRLPVFAFVTREPTQWHGSAWRHQHVGRWNYDETPECFAEVAEAIELLVGPSGSIPPRPTIIRAWSHHGPTRDAPATARRIAFARRSWELEGERSPETWTEIEFGAAAERRNSGAIGDLRPMPFVKDVVEHAIAGVGVGPGDIIALTNADVACAPGITGWILDRCREDGCAYTHRWDFKRFPESPFVSESEVRIGEWYPGSDAFFFTVEWWRKHRIEYPDMILGREHCDEVLRQLIKRHGGREIVGAIYHEKHASFWEEPGVREFNPGNIHNRRLARQWFLRNGYGPNDPWWWMPPGGSIPPRPRGLPVDTTPERVG